MTRHKRIGKEVGGDSDVRESVAGRMSVTTDTTVSQSVIGKGVSREFNSGVKLGKDLMIDRLSVQKDLTEQITMEAWKTSI